jgi:hypothetical protein
MTSSFKKINYALRPGKHAARRMLCEIFGSVHPFQPVDEYVYVGFGFTAGLLLPSEGGPTSATLCGTREQFRELGLRVESMSPLTLKTRGEFIEDYFARKLAAKQQPTKEDCMAKIKAAGYRGQRQANRDAYDEVARKKGIEVRPGRSKKSDAKKRALPAGPMVMAVNPSVPTQTVPEFIAYAKDNPGKVAMASAGTGNGPDVGGELFKMMNGVNIVHVPYSGGGGQAITDLLTAVECRSVSTSCPQPSNTSGPASSARWR